ncbi:MAG: NAD-dependent epimerase/dehydratase family protein [Vicinamibacterales bacterium]
MTVFVAGGSGTIGRPLVRALVAAGHHVVATTRSPAKRDRIARLGAEPVTVDALDAPALARAVSAASPTHVVHQLTALPAAGPRSDAELAQTNRLREEGTRNLLRAAQSAGARRFIVGSFAPLTASSSSPGALAPSSAAARAAQSMERQALDAARAGAIEAVVLRYGLFYGADVPSTSEMLALVRRRRLPALRADRGRLPFVHLDDAVAATVAALDRGASGGIYHIVDDRPVSFSEFVRAMADIGEAPTPFAIPRWLMRLAAPYMARMLEQDMCLSNADARRELRWEPAYPTCRDGIRQVIAEARRAQ